MTPSSAVINLSRDSSFSENQIYRCEFANNKDILFDLFYSTIFYNELVDINVNSLLSKLVSKVPLIIPAFWCSHQSRVTKLTTVLNWTVLRHVHVCFEGALSAYHSCLWEEITPSVCLMYPTILNLTLSLLVNTGVSSIPSFRIELVACEWILMPYFRAYIYFALKNIISCL